jgi:hypothetical protein
MGMLAFLYKILNKEVLRHRTVNIESLDMQNFLNCEEAFVSLTGTSDKLCLQSKPWRTNMASTSRDSYVAFKV